MGQEGARLPGSKALLDAIGLREFLIADFDAVDDDAPLSVRVDRSQGADEGNVGRTEVGGVNLCATFVDQK